MSQRLAQTLITHQILPRSDVEDAMQRQVIFGGHLGTSILEAELLTESQLEQALHQAYGLDVVGKADIDQISPHVPRLFPKVFAETYRLAPLNLDGDRLSVMVSDEPDAGIFERIRERLQLSLEAKITSEVRLHYAMNTLYGADLLPRFRNLISKIDGVTVINEPGATESSKEVLSWGVSSAQLSAAQHLSRPKYSFRDILKRMDYADSRDAAIDLLLQGCALVFDVAGLFVVQGTSINGWRGTSPELTKNLAQISISAEMPSVFQTLYATQGHYLGPVPDSSVNNTLLQNIERARPRTAFLAPISVGGRLTMILYGDNGPKSISPKRAAAVLMLGQKAGLALERVIRRRKAMAEVELEASSFEVDTENASLSFQSAEPIEDEVEVVEVHEHEFEVISDSELTPMSEAEDDWEDVSFGGVDSSAEASMAAFTQGVEDAGDIEIEIDDDYVAFSDVEDDPEENLDGWGDVLIDAADAAVASPEPKSRPITKPGSTSVSWQDVIAEALRAKSIQPAGAAKTFEVAGQIVDSTELLFDSIDASNPETRRDAISRVLQMGDGLDAAVAERFPGRIDFDPLAPNSRVPPFPQCSGLTSLIAAWGVQAAPTVLPFLEDEDPVKRFFAIYYLLACPYPPALEALSRRLYDSEARNRYLAADALRVYAGAPGYPRILEALRGQLKVPVLSSQIAAVQILGQLRDPGCVPALIPLVITPKPELSRAAISALAVLCARDYGPDVAQWSEWWQKNYNRPRPIWLIGGLRHNNSSMRRIANYELQLLTGLTTNYDPDGEPEVREEATIMWENWWKQQLARNDEAKAPHPQA